ncbi:MAG: thrombospondin type 3 repeat-containing protein [Gemmatimonadota bacterium]|nr:thrombospondin type 3 repeat-containing protein [Gemmatimonadota bacterium]
MRFSTMKSFFIAGLIVCSSWVHSAQAGHRGGAFYVSPVFPHMMWYQTPNLMDDGPLWGCRAGVDLCRFVSIEGFGMRGFTEISPDDAVGKTRNSARYDAFGIGARLNVPIRNVVPFLSVSGGKSWLRTDYRMKNVNNVPVDVKRKNMRNLLALGAGLEIFFSDSWAIRIDAVDHMPERDFIDRDWRGDRKTHNWEFGAGLTILLGKAVKTPVDSDGDGAPDDIDHCPGTPAGVAVYSNGCPLDSDRDGVPDYLDNCPDTPAGVEVDPTGCPVEKEEEPKAPEVDSDGDGVPDSEDRCPGTPRGAKVDPGGCAVDSDRDGVPDGLDACPGTPAGLPVDERGCPEFAPEDFHLRVLFDMSRAQVKREFFSELNRIAGLMKENGKVELELVGYTDKLGSAEFNLILSEKRTRAVRDYLVSEGVSEERLFMTAGGEFPVDAETGIPMSMQRCVIVRLKR